MKRIIIAVLLGASLALGANDLVVNPPVKTTTSPGPVNVILRDTAGAYVAAGGGGGATAVGAAHVANSQVATSTTAGTLVIARATRVSCLVRNLDTAITVYIGQATVTSANGMPIKAGESVVISAVTLWQVIAASGTPSVAILDEYN